jgi:predicted nucleic acid-binding Zn ribbon protein
MFAPPTAKTAARGYGGAHQKLRAQWAPKVATGAVLCWRCGHPIQPGQPWDLGHDDHDRTTYRGPEHRHRTAHCVGNRKAGARKGARIGNAKQRMIRTLGYDPINGCPECGCPLTPQARAAGRKYCSQRCGWLAHKDDPPRTPTPRKVKQPKPSAVRARQCEMCGTTYVGRRIYCSDQCAEESNARKARERYREAEGLEPTWDRPRYADRW